ncbi:hypothetical protein CPLU01_12129 [Colletotrichum plurivorum]|uniref:Amino acid permease/ SLC12A domain-containing protein n=1 Tax=Colletotrichum plurivorum TaxID=2175906 RepID=A0A8H6JZQ6_9PEZI|nr:hypothetical protein CPLU01_12129 [Colletotrichum plurivorum]
MSKNASDGGADEVSLQTFPRGYVSGENLLTAGRNSPNGTLNTNGDPDNPAVAIAGRTTLNRKPVATFTIPRDPDTTMITINGTFGTGLYLRSGQILELGGPVAVLISFILLGFLSWAVMQCITEMLCIWPVPGALLLFVRKFVDKELGIAVGVAYWFCYSVIFAATIAAAATTLDYWTADIPGFTVGVVYVVLPLALVAINMLKIEIFGWFEVVTGAIKIGFLLIIMVCLIAVYGKNGVSDESKKSWDEKLFEHDTDAASKWAEAFFMCLSIAAYAYVGVEIIAVSTGNAVKFAAGFAPVAIAFAYISSGLLVSIDLQRTDCDLPQLSWINRTECPVTNGTALNETASDSKNSTSSPFVLVAKRSHIKGLDDAFNAFIVFTALTSANTSLYVASRTLFGLTRNVHGPGIILESLSWFGKTDRNRVPLRAMLLSAVAFCWVPFLQEQEGGFDTGGPIGKFFEILGQLGAVSVIIVWTCQCLAYIRFHRCIRKHEGYLSQEEIHLVRDRKQGSVNYPFRSHLQPVLAYLALIGCLIVLIVCNGAFLWKEFDFFPFLSGYLTIFVFLALWFGLKIFQQAPWSFVDLNEVNVKELIEHLDELRSASMEQPESDSEPRWASIWRMFGFRRDGSQLRTQSSRW